MSRFEIKADFSVTDAGEITGIAWPFGAPDRVGDVIEKGAFSAPATLPILWGHDQMQVVGVWNEIAETEAGLTVKGRLLVDEVERAREVHALIKAQAATGLSIGFQTIKASPRGRGRTITALNLHEISVVAVPCHPGAQITSLKHGDTTMNEEKRMDPEEIKKMIADAVAAIPANDAPGIDVKAFEAVQKRLDEMEAKASRPQGVHIAAENVERKAFDTFLRRGAERMAADEIKALTVANNTNGGYLAPDEVGKELIKLLSEYSPIRKYAKVIQIGAPEITYPRRLTGTGATWVSEIVDRTESGMTFEQIKLTPHELATFTDISTQLLEDNAFNVEGELIADYAESFARAEGLAFVKGTGAGQPFGVLSNEDVAVHEVPGAGIGASLPEIVIRMYHMIASTYAQNGVWLMNRKTLGILRQITDANGRPLVAEPISESMPATLLGRPLVEAVDMDDLYSETGEPVAGAVPILFGDLSGYRIVDRIGLSTLRDPFTLATKGQVRFHARKRVGADVTHPDRFIKLTVAA